MARAPYRNLSSVFLGRVFENTVAIAFVAVLARSGKEILGTYYFGRAIASMTAEVCELGVSRFAIHTLSGDLKRGYERVFGVVVAGRLVANAMGFMVVAACCRVLHLSGPVTRSALGFTAAFLIVNVADLFLDVLRAGEDMQTPALLSAAYKVGFAALSIFGLAKGHGLDWVVGAMLASSAVHLVLCVAIVASANGIPRLNAESPALLRLATHVRPFALLTLLAVLNGKIVLWLLYGFRGTGAVGEYGAAFQLVEALMIFAFAMNSAAFPRFAADFKTAGLLAVDGPAAGLKILLLVIVPIAAGTTVLASRIVPLLYGTQYAAAVPLLQIGAWVAVALFVNALLVTVLQAVGRAGAAVRLLLPVLLVNILLGFAVIPRFGGLGAAWATLFTQLLLVALQLRALPTSVRLAAILEGTGGLFAATAGMVLVIAAARGLPTLTLILLGGLVYLFLCSRLCPLSARDVGWLRSTLKETTSGQASRMEAAINVSSGLS